MAVQPSLCRTWSETPKTGFLTTRLNSYLTFRSRYGELESVEIGLSRGDVDDIRDDVLMLSKLLTSFFRAVCNKSQSIVSSGVVKLSLSIHETVQVTLKLSIYY